MFPEFDSSFRSVEYISKMDTSEYQIESELSKIFRLVSNIYESDGIVNDIKRR